MTPKAIVQQYFQAFGAGDLEAILACLHDDVVWNVAGAPHVATVGLLQGKARVQRWLERFPQEFQPLEFVIDDFFELGDDVLTTGRFRHRILSTGRIAGSDLAIRFTVRDGRISRYQILEDADILARAFAADQPWGLSRQRVNGNVYAYDDRGAGPAVLFAHGLFVDHHIFTPQLAELEQTCRCLAMDLPGHGQSDTPDAPWTLDGIAADLALFIQENHLAPVHFVGLSQGGMIGLRLAARYPALVGTLALLGVTAHAEAADRLDGWQTLRSQLLDADSATLDAAFSQLQQRIYPASWLAAHEDVARRERQRMYSHDRRGMALGLDAAVLQRGDCHDLLPRITAQTLVICGEHDAATPPEHAQAMAAAIPNARVEIIPGAGHHLPLEVPGQTTALLKTLL